MKICKNDCTTVIIEKVMKIREEIKSRNQFRLPEGICPGDSDIDLRAGFKKGIYEDEKDNLIPVIIILQSKEKLFGLFINLLKMVFQNSESYCYNVDIFLKSRHLKNDYYDYLAEEINLATFLKDIYDFEDLLVNDGGTGISVFSLSRGLEINFSDDKTIFVYTKERKWLYEISCFLIGQNLEEMPDLATAGESENHIHSSKLSWERQFKKLVAKFGAQYFGTADPR